MLVITSTRADYQHVVLLRSMIIISFLTIITLPSLHCDRTPCEKVLDKCVETTELIALHPEHFLNIVFGYENTHNGLCLACRNISETNKCFRVSQTSCTVKEYIAFANYRNEAADLLCSYMKEFEGMADAGIKCVKDDDCHKKFLPNPFKCEHVSSHLNCSTEYAKACGSTNTKLYLASQYLRIRYTDKEFTPTNDATSFEICLEKMKNYDMLPDMQFNLKDYCKKAFENSSTRITMTSCKWPLIGSLLVSIRCILPLWSF